MKKYIVESGDILRKAEEHRARHIQLLSGLFAIAKQYGAEEIKCDSDMMLLHGIRVTGQIPDGWHAPKWLNGFCRPKKTKENAEIRRHFTPAGRHTCQRHPDLKAFDEWLACPHWHEYTTADGKKCGETIWSAFDCPRLAWFSADGPLLLRLPDIANIKANAIAAGHTPLGSALDWAPPDGLRESCDEEWEYLVARHKFEKRNKNAEAKP